MKSFSKKLLKTASAYILSTAILATSALSGFSPVAGIAKKAVNEVVAEASTADMLSSDERGVIYANSRTDFRDETIYFLITTRFYDGDSTNNTTTSEDTKANNAKYNDCSWRGDFAGLIDKLDYIKALGFTAIWITPVVQNNSGYDYHGYHAYNFNAVDYRYESNGIDYQTLIDAVHAKGMKIIQDVVFNHTCNWGEEGLNALGGDSLGTQLSSDVYSTRNQVVMNGTGDPLNIFHHNGFCGGGDWDNFEAQRKTIADDCFDLNTENPVVYNYLVDAYKKYIDMGVDAFRVDTVKHISRLTLNTAILPDLVEEAESNGNDNFYMFGEVCTKGHDVWYRDAPPISTCFYTWDNDASYKSLWSSTDESVNTELVATHYTDHADTSNQPTSTNAFLNGNSYHTPDYSNKSAMDVIDFQMHWSFNNASSAFSTALNEDQYFNDSTWNVVYVDSHDYAPDNCQTTRYTGGTDAWAENLSLMFTFRGIPCVYYGSEVEFKAGYPIDVGPNSPLEETGRAYYGDYLEGNVDTTDFTEFGNLSGNVETTLKKDLSQHIMRLNRIRQAVPALRKGQYSTDGCSGNLSFKRRYTDDTTDSFALVAISGSSTFTDIPNGTYVDAVTGDIQTVTNNTLTANVSGTANMKVYVLNTTLTPAPGRVIPNGTYLTDGGTAEIIDNGDVDVVEPTSVTLSDSSVSVKEALTTTITATVLPENASKKTVTWTSSDNSVATVSGGVITGVSVGTAVITAKTSNGLTATCNVTVTENTDIVKPTSITLDNTNLTVLQRNSETLTATVLPANATNKTVTWSSSDSNIASVSGGVVTGVSAGTAVITATTSNGLSATCNVTVEANTDDLRIYFDNSSSWSTVNAYIWNNTTVVNNGSWPGNAMAYDSASGYYYIDVDTSAFDMIIFNNGSGTQTADLTIPTNGNNLYTYSSSAWSTYSPSVSVASVSLNQNTLALNTGDSSSLTATVLPTNATNKGVTWTSSKNSVATVDDNGLVTAVASGIATITVTTDDGNYTASCNVTVSDPVDNDLDAPVAYATSNSNQTVKVSWEAVDGATSYQLYKYFASSGVIQKSKVVTDTYATFSGLTAGKRYKYIVQAISDTGASDNVDGSFAVDAMVGKKNDTSVVPTASYNYNKGCLTLSWDKVDGVSTYYVYKYYMKTKTLSSPKEVSKNYATYYTATPGKTYRYLVSTKKFTDSELSGYNGKDCISVNIPTLG